MNIYTVSSDYFAIENTIVGEIDLHDYFPTDKSLDAQNAWINVGGWQSWNPAFEVEPNKKQPSLCCTLVRPWNKYLKFPQTQYCPSKNFVLGQFIIYLRWENYYLVIASVGNLENLCPPVQFIVDRKQNKVLIELYDQGKYWLKDELQAKIEIFTAESYFECRQKLESIFGNADPASIHYSKRFDSINHLGLPSLGWESWYNHYANITQKQIINDLNSLSEKPNFVTLSEMNLSRPNHSQSVFQIDDGWEMQLGNWEYDKNKFPDGLQFVTNQIEKKGFIPGLWIAPFIIDARTNIAKEHPEWLLRDLRGSLVSAGFNPLWGRMGTFYCLDLSIDEVVDYLDKTIEKIIEQWGFRFIKMDFLYAGMLFGNFQNGDAAYRWYDRAIKRITSRTANKEGKPVCYLGCGVPFESSFNYFPLSRIGCDTFENWENKLSKMLNWNGRNSAYLNIKDTLGHAMWDKIVFANDPDVLFIRNENCTLTKNEKLLIAAVDSMFGSQLMYSDNPNTSDASDESLLTREIIDLQKKIGNKEFSITNIEQDKYMFNSKDGSLNGSIDLTEKHTITFHEQSL